MKTKSNTFRDMITELRERHRLMSLSLLEDIKVFGKDFYGKRFVFKNPRVKNRTYKILGLEYKNFSLLPVNSRKRKSTGFIGIKNNASFFGYALYDVQLDFVKMQHDGYDSELIKIERTLHSEFSNKTRAMMLGCEIDMVAEKILDADADFFLASKGCNVKDLKTSSSLHQGKIKGLRYNPCLNEIDVTIESKYQGTQYISNCNHILNIWN